MAKRIYKVDIAFQRDSAKYNATHLVRANNREQAAAHVLKGSVSVTIPAQAELWALGGAGCQIEDA